MLVFGGALFYLQTMPGDFESRAQGFIVDEINDAIMPDSAMSKLAQMEGTLNLPEDRIEALRVNLAASTRNFIALVVKTMCAGDCAKKGHLKAELLEAYDAIQSRLKPGFGTLRGMVEAEYHAVFDELRRDIKIFLSANLIVLGLALVLALIRGRAARHLAPISIVMTIATLLTSYWYIFGQNWVLTIVTSDYSLVVPDRPRRDLPVAGGYRDQSRTRHQPNSQRAFPRLPPGSRLGTVLTQPAARMLWSAFILL